MTHFTRTFHPVGQGAFYSETHDSDNTRFTVVYDCGSQKDKAWLEQRVKSGLGSLDVDILFISHFDKDHISGVKFLKPKKIVIPFFSDEELIILGLHNLVFGTQFQTSFISDLRQRYKGNLIEVSPMSDETFIRGFENPEMFEESNGNGSRQIPSGTVVGLSKAFPVWIYIPFNPNLNKKIFQLFIQELTAAKLDIKLLQDYDSQYVIDNLSKIKTAFRKVGKLNDHSMVVYSGPIPVLWHGSPLYEYSQIRTAGNAWTCPYHCHRRNYWDNGLEGSSCLYTGDIPLKDSKDNDNGILRSVYSAMPQDLIDNISTIQIPHHGSSHNYHPVLKSFWDRSSGEMIESDRELTYIISAGESNTFGHPSWWVIGDLLNLDPVPNIQVVSENPISGLIQQCRY